jgi:glycosyltransferase involved in cell wall biosynthesis
MALKNSIANCVSVIIPVLNEAETISGILSDLQGQQAYVTSVIVVDGGSSDATELQAKKFPFVTFVRAAKANVAHQRNVGALKASGKWLVFVDADVRLSKGAIKHMIAEMEARQLDIGCPLYKPTTDKRFLQFVYQFFNAFFVLFQRLAPSGGGMGIVVRSELFTKADGFDETLTYEDIAFIRKASRLGKFGMLCEKIEISVRRFEKQGTVRVFAVYLLLSIFFITGQFKLANRIRYHYDYRQ